MAGLTSLVGPKLMGHSVRVLGGSKMVIFSRSLFIAIQVSLTSGLLLSASAWGQDAPFAANASVSEFLKPVSHH